ncbi:hypothetical protein CB0940_01388 [Cercospora beticola]|uniref:Alpha/beta hydrolase fold-3 domain-containing protein n=1 Tax=Cercospora beticola TaxID=122368 RepID=A0A2G5I8G9_CERBT|nr:hypothetical protein CB0940_01388 [Cercospora beticola]PIB01080.1 hypothetical protein CB0940_01388 [Cercospora beticola]WPA96827.1 hypothetical protein RHO25_001435 [Cercospora beticola]CAK1354803.1 unnamed protein product [Cercospora beticola]
MSAQSSPVPTLLDKLLVVPLLARVLGAAVFRALTLPITSTAKANKTFKDIVFAALRANLANINVAQEQWLNASTESGYLDFAKKANVQPDTDVLPSGLKVHWLGPKAASKTILYFHGGGYALSCTAGHFQWLFGLQNELSKTTAVSVVVVAYTLTPKGQYPEQLRQAAESLEWLTGTVGKKTEDIIVAGDSAGANLTIGLLSHLLHPHPELPNPTAGGSLAAAVLISPWIKFSTTDDSFRRNATSDMIPPAAADRWKKLFLGEKSSDKYSEPSLADSAWYSGLDKVVNDILIWGGDKEVLIDSIKAFGTTIEKAHAKTTIVIESGAAHEDFILDTLLGYKEKAEGTKVIESWLATRL